MVYPSDLTDSEWSILEPHVQQGRMGRPRQHDIRKIIDGVRYINRGGCQWRMLPKEFPPWKTVYDYYFRWRENGTWDRIHDSLRTACRLKANKEPSPSAAIIDSQSVKTVQKGGSMVMMQAKRPKAESVILQLIHWVCC